MESLGKYRPSSLSRVSIRSTRVPAFITRYESLVVVDGVNVASMVNPPLVVNPDFLVVFTHRLDEIVPVVPVAVMESMVDLHVVPDGVRVKVWAFTRKMHNHNRAIIPRIIDRKSVV